jgi:hypothetical protein
MAKILKPFGVGMLALILACSDSDDPSPGPTSVDLPAVSVANIIVPEGNTALFTVTLDQTTDHAVTFAYTTIDGTATAGADYVATSGRDTIPTGQISTTILVVTIDNSVVEVDEMFSFSLSSVSGGTVEQTLATAIIKDNDVNQVSFATDIQPLLRTSCAQLQPCHGGAIQGGNMYLSTSAAYDTVIAATGMITGGLVIQPGNSAASTLYTKTTDNYPFRSQMPYAAAPLSLDQQHLIRDWIDQGANDN